MRPYQKIQEANLRIEDAIQNNLSELDLSDLELENYQIPYLISRIEEKLPNIESLNLSNNNLTEIAPEIKIFRNLKSLNLSDNRLKKIPPEIGELKDIEEIELNVNELTELPPELSNLQKLAYINLGQNNFEKFPPELCEIKNLEYLIFNENYVSDIPDEISNLQNLKYLDLNRNDLYSEIPDHICNFPKLQYLDLSENNLDTINDKIVNLHDLEHLCLQRNNIEELPSNIGDFKSLEILELQGNRVSEIPNSIDSIKNLRVLNLKNNPLSAFALHYVINNLGKIDVNFDMTAHEEESDYEEVLALIYPGETDHIITQINNLNPSWEFENGNETVIEAKGTLAKIKSQEIEDPHGTKKVRAQRALKLNTLNAKSTIIGFLKKIPVDNSKIDEEYSDAAKHLIDLILNESEEDNTRMIELVKMAESLGNCATGVKSLLAQTYVLKYYNVEPKPKNYESMFAREAIESEIISRLKNKIINNKEILRKTEQIEQVQGLVNAIFFEGAVEHVENKCKIVFKDGEKPNTLSSKTANIDLSFFIIMDELAIEFAKLCCETNQNGQLLVNNEGKYLFSLEKLETIKKKFERENLGVFSVKELVIIDFIAKVQSYIRDNSDLANLHFDKPEVAAFIDSKFRENELRAKFLGVPDNDAPKIADDFFDSQKSVMEKILNDNKTEEMQIDDNTPKATTDKLDEIGTPPNKSHKRSQKSDSQLSDSQQQKNPPKRVKLKK